MKKFVKIFFIFCICFIVTVFLIIFIFRLKGVEVSSEVFLNNSLKYGILGAFIIALILFLIDFVARVSGGVNGKNEVKAGRSLVLKLNSSEVFDKIIKVLNDLDMKVIDKDERGCFINAKTKSNWKSFGENIVIKFKVLKDNESEVVVKSSPVIKTTIFDYGKNTQNVEKIYDGLLGK